MSLISVDSSVLLRVGHDSDSQTLWLQFRSLAVYCYFGVPDTVYCELAKAASKGAYFNRYIRDRYPFCRLSNTSSLP